MSKKEQLFKRMVRLPADEHSPSTIAYFATEFENDVCKFVDWRGNSITRKWSDDIVEATDNEIVSAVTASCRYISSMMGFE